MRISLNWLKDYVTLPGTVEELAHRLTMAGLEVESIERPGAGLSGVVVAQIIESTKHPNADKLSVTKVATGKDVLQVVCGATNFKVADKVPLATVGTVLPSGLEIKQATLRGVDSFGMLCSARELGVSQEASGLLVLDAAIPIGTPIAHVLGLDDVILQLNVTPNRADALSMLGVAREIATLTGASLHRPSFSLSESGPAASSHIQIRIEDAERCWRYAARVIEGVTVKPSPQWMQDRLKAAGVRSIHNLVDVTNYVMLEYGQPLHAFDLDRIGGGQIVVRTSRGQETLKTLDEKERVLHADDLLICDGERPLVLAGVMGGASSEVSASTTRVLLECATFQPVTVRRTAKRHGLKTESSHRFERGTDVSKVPEVLDRAAALMTEVGGGTVLAGQVDVYPDVKAPRQVLLRSQKLAEVLGVAVASSECSRILSSLGFVRVSGDEAQALWEVPLGRVDVSIEEDLIEEVARIRGYDAIPLALPRGVSQLEGEASSARAERRVRSALAGAGFDEVVNYSFVAPAELAAFEAERTAIALLNPLSVEQSVMRTTLFASLVPNVVLSVRHQATGVRFYEMARTYQPNPDGGRNGVPVAWERQEVAGAIWGVRDGAKSWTSKDVAVDFYDVKGAVESVLAALHIENGLFEAWECPWYHPRACARVMRDGVVLGSLGELHPVAAAKLHAPEGVFLFQLDFDALVASAELSPQARALTRFPSVLRDLAVVVPLEMASHEVRKVILEVGQPMVEDAHVFDVYAGAQVGAGKKNLAYALRYRSLEKTLQDAEVNEAHGRIVAEVNRRLGAVLRT